MDLIKRLLRERIEEGLINEHFFEKMEHPLDELVECVKDLLINLRSIVEEKHKIGFFKNRLVKALEEFKENTGGKRKLISKVSELEDEFDSLMLKQLKISELLIKVSESKTSGKIIDDYINSFDNTIEKVYDTFKAAIKKDKAYEAIKAINGDTKKISFKKFLRKKYLLQIELLKLQEWVVSNKKKLLIVFEGRDAAGKGSNIGTFSEFLNPKHLRIETFGVPTAEEKKDWFKRYKKVLPEEGEIVLFDRSWYNRAVIEPAMKYCTKAQYDEFMDEVNPFEENLLIKNDVILIKLWFDITKDKQHFRFELRKRDPLKYWKFSENDAGMVENWDKLTPYIDKMLEYTNTTHSPWYVVDSDDKFGGILTAMELTIDRIHYDGKDERFITRDDKPTKVIFSDVHGVLITDISLMPNGEKNCNKGWSKSAIKNLNELTDKTGAVIVLISSCKNNVEFDELKANLKKAGITGTVAGKTIHVDKRMRGEQVEDWLDRNNVTEFVIIDDTEYDSRKLYPKQYIQPKTNIGFSETDLTLAIEKLK